jgi:NAD dependent epimerase/dehydratase
VSLAGQSVLVTGAEGFIGSHLVELLVAQGARTRAFCRYDAEGRRGWIDTLAPEIQAELDVWPGDVCDARDVEAATEGMEYVLHLAALISIPHSYRSPEAFVRTNITGMLNVLEAARRHGVSRVVQTSTSEVYGTPEVLPITEDHPLKAQSPYSASKIAADKLCEAYACTYGVPVVVLRPFNTYGPRQSPRAVIPTILGQLLSGAGALELGNLAPRRDLTFVTDTAGAFPLAATASLPAGSVVQLGTGHAVSVGELAERAQTIVGRNVPVTTVAARSRPASSEVDLLLSDPARAAELLGWRATVDIDEGLRRTAAWVAERIDGRDWARYYW